MALTFQKASKQLAKAKIAFTGPSGSGKTLSALLLAKGLTNSGRVGVLDTENNSASLYVDRFPDWEYFVLPMNPPYTAQKYLAAINVALNEKLDCLVIDSLTHLWAGEGGLLQQKEALDSRGGNSYTNWGAITKLHEEIKSKILHSPIHLIATMRSKQEYILETNERGKQAPKKVGLAPIQREGMEYEFTVVFDIGMDHQFMVSKDRTDLFDGVVSKVTEQTGKDLHDWLTDTPDQKVDQAAELVQAPIEAPQADSRRVMNHATKEFVEVGQSAAVAKPSAPPGVPAKSLEEALDGIPEPDWVTDAAMLPPTGSIPAPKRNPGDFDPGEYVCTFGRDKGKTLHELGPKSVQRTLDWISKECKEPLAKSLAEFKTYANQYKAGSNHAAPMEG